jgi:hypothetical protein
MGPPGPAAPVDGAQQSLNLHIYHWSSNTGDPEVAIPYYCAGKNIVIENVHLLATSDSTNKFYPLVVSAWSDYYWLRNFHKTAPPPTNTFFDEVQTNVQWAVKWRLPATTSYVSANMTPPSGAATWQFSVDLQGYCVDPEEP